MADEILKLDGSDSLLLGDDGSELLLESPAPTLTQLLTDSGAHIELIVKGQYLDETDTLHTEWISQTGWDDEVSGPAAIYIPPLLTTNLRINHQVEPLEILSSLNTFGDIELSNNHLTHAGRYDLWWRYSVDGLDWIVYAVGVLSNGTRVELSHVVDTPLFELQGVNIPEVGSDTCSIRCRDRISLDTALQPQTYSPPALYFPGTIAGSIDLGNNLDITGNQSLSAWVYLTDPVSSIQYITFKDSGAVGYYLAVGAVGAGTIAAGVELCVRGQSPDTTTTPANVLQPYRWHRIDIAIGATSRRIDIDGITAVTTAGITGTPTAAPAVSLLLGKSLLGRMSNVIYWSVALSNAAMAAIGRVPITGAETNLREAFTFPEGLGTTTTSVRAGSALVGTLGTGILWDTASWHYDSILGQYEPYVLGTVPRVPVTWIDPPKQIGQVSRGPIALLSELQSNHTAVSTSNYTVNLSNGIITVTVGALSGTYSATVTANNLWNSAALFNGTTSTGTATVAIPTGSRYFATQFQANSATDLLSVITGWADSTNGFNLQLRPPGVNKLTALLTNDAGTVFTAVYSTPLVPGRKYSALVSLDTANLTTGLQLYVNGALVATTAISGTFTWAISSFTIGHHSPTGLYHFNGIVDEIITGNTAGSLAIAKAHHSLPSTSSTPGIVNGWHLDEATGSSAAPFVGAASITLSNVTWTAGRSAAVDLARSILYSYGYDESDLDTDLWLAALNDNLADCGWFVSGGAKGIDTLNVILGGLGFVLYRSLGLLAIRRFEGLSGTAQSTIDYDLELQSQPIEPIASDPAIYLWIVTYATNNSKQDAANIAGGLATTDPDRYQYGSMAAKSLPKSDGAILSRFPNAEARTRVTALLYNYDAEAEAVRLLALHRYAADRKSIQAFANIGRLDILTKVGPLMPEADLDEINMIVTGIAVEDGLGTLTIWRPAI